MVNNSVGDYPLQNIYFSSDNSTKWGYHNFSPPIQQKQPELVFNNIDYSVILQPLINTENEEKKMKQTRHWVRVLVWDPDVRVSDDDALLYKSEEFLTTKTEEELRSEVDYKGLLEAHNNKRVKVIDEEKSETVEKDIFLKPIRMRDLETRVLLCVD
jgi:hypothetical protein